jgi:hypothetical protein
MKAWLLTALLLGAAPSVDTARALSADAAWTELLTTFGDVDESAYSDKERAELAKLFLSAASRVAKGRPGVGFALALRASRFEPSPNALATAAVLARKMEDPAKAREVLQRAVALYPTQHVFTLMLGELALAQGDAEEGRALLEGIPARAKEHAAAQALLRRKTPAAPKTRERARGATGTEGMRARTTGRFTVRYFNGERDYEQRSSYEAQVLEALEEAYRFTRRVLGRARETPVEVVMYSREEFIAAHGLTLGGVAAGFYGEGAIRINNGAKLDRANRATLVHEYVHAAVDALCDGATHHMPVWLNEGLAEYLEWRFLGVDSAPRPLALHAKAAANSNRLPSLESLGSGGMLREADPLLSYTVAALAVKRLLAAGGSERFLGLLRATNSGTPLDEALHERYGKKLAQLDAEVKSDVVQR